MMRYLVYILIFSPLCCYAADIMSCQNISVAGTYTLQNDVSSEGTCFLVTANDVVIDLNGYTITYDNATPITINNGSFETSLTGTWDLNGATNITAAEGAYLDATVYDGDYALKITTPTNDISVASVSTVTLEANTQYSLSGMIYNMIDDNITMSIDFDGTAIATSQTGRTWRGMQYIYAQFTTTTEAAYTINLVVSGASGVSTGAVYFDDIRVQQSGHYGVDAGNSGNNWARNIVIKNGTITQGQAHGDWSHNIYLTGQLPDDVPSFGIYDLILTVAGNSCKAINTVYMSNAKIHDCTINSTVDTIAVRDHYDGALIYVAYASYNGEIYNNTITSGIQTGIFVRSSASTNRIQVYNNSITLQSKYTNDFAIVSYGNYGTDIYDNTIDCASGNNTCRGIYNNSNGGSIYDNVVAVHYRKNNQEYGGCGGSAYGIQIEQDAIDVEVYGNTVTSNADECGAIAFRYFGPGADSELGINIHDNIFKSLVIGNSDQLASTMGILETYADHMTFTDNLLVTNSNFILFGLPQAASDNRSFSIDNNTFSVVGIKAAKYYPLLSSTFPGNAEGYEPRNVTISDNICLDAITKADMDTAVFKSIYMDYATDTYAHNINIQNKLLTKLNGNSSFTIGGNSTITFK